MNCRKDTQYNEKKKTTLSNERRQTSCVDYRNGQLLSNKSDGLLDMGGVMKKEDLDYDKLEVQVTVTYKGKKWNNFEVSDESLYSIYEDIDQYLEDSQ